MSHAACDGRAGTGVGDLEAPGDRDRGLQMGLSLHWFFCFNSSSPLSPRRPSGGKAPTPASAGALVLDPLLRLVQPLLLVHVPGDLGADSLVRKPDGVADQRALGEDLVGGLPRPTGLRVSVSQRDNAASPVRLHGLLALAGVEPGSGDVLHRLLWPVPGGVRVVGHELLLRPAPAANVLHPVLKVRAGGLAVEDGLGAVSVLGLLPGLGDLVAHGDPLASPLHHLLGGAEGAARDTRGTRRSSTMQSEREGVSAHGAV